MMRNTLVLALGLGLGGATAAAQQPEIAIVLAFTEGPTVDKDGNVYFSELVGERILKLTPRGVLTTFRAESNAANGLLIDPQGRLIAAEGAESNRAGILVKHTPRVTRTDVPIAMPSEAITASPRGRSAGAACVRGVAAAALASVAARASACSSAPATNPASTPVA